MTAVENVSPVQIRPATAADRGFVLDLAERLAECDLPAWRTKAEVVQGDRRELVAWFDGPDTPGERMLIAEIDGAPAGVAYLFTDQDFFTRRAHGHLSVLAVSAEAEGRGVGAALIDASMDWARAEGFDKLTLSVFVGNERAKRVYERHGFEPEILRYTKRL